MNTIVERRSWESLLPDGVYEDYINRDYPYCKPKRTVTVMSGGRMVVFLCEG